MLQHFKLYLFYTTNDYEIKKGKNRNKCMAGMPKYMFIASKLNLCIVLLTKMHKFFLSLKLEVIFYFSEYWVPIYL